VKKEENKTKTKENMQVTSAFRNVSIKWLESASYAVFLEFSTQW
jgi:hypothetical protein